MKSGAVIHSCYLLASTEWLLILGLLFPSDWSIDLAIFKNKQLKSLLIIVCSFKFLFNSRGILKVLLVGTLRRFLLICLLYAKIDPVPKIELGGSRYSCVCKHYDQNRFFPLQKHLRNLFLLDFTHVLYKKYKWSIFKSLRWNAPNLILCAIYHKITSLKDKSQFCSLCRGNNCCYFCGCYFILNFSSTND